MKKIIVILLILLSSFCYSQDSKLNFEILEQNLELRAGTCASPDGANKSIISPPPDYDYLNTNGYCYVVSPAVPALKSRPCCNISIFNLLS